MDKKEIDELFSSQFKNADMFSDKPSPRKHVYTTKKSTPRETPSECFIHLTSGHSLLISLDCNNGSLLNNSLKYHVVLNGTFVPREIIENITFQIR